MPYNPQKIYPDDNWPHLQMWKRVNSLFFSLPNYFKTDLSISGINVTETFSVGGALTSIVDSQVVDILNRLRNVWDPENEYSDYAFIRQSQTFPDVLLQNLKEDSDVLFGIELKSWYVLSKEGQPSFRFKVTPEACAPADLLVVIPWLLSDVISGTPKLLSPFKEQAKYAAEYRNYYWKNSRIERGENAEIRKPPPENRHPYPDSKQVSSDVAESDDGGNFGRIARSGILDDFIDNIKMQDYIGVKIRHWISFFKAISETRTDDEVERKLELLKKNITDDALKPKDDQGDTEYKKVFLDILERIEKLWNITP